LRWERELHYGSHGLEGKSNKTNCLDKQNHGWKHKKGAKTEAYQRGWIVERHATKKNLIRPQATPGTVKLANGKENVEQKKKSRESTVRGKGKSDSRVQAQKKRNATQHAYEPQVKGSYRKRKARKKKPEEELTKGEGRGKKRG